MLVEDLHLKLKLTKEKEMPLQQWELLDATLLAPFHVHVIEICRTFEAENIIMIHFIRTHWKDRNLQKFVVYMYIPLV